MRMFFFLDFSEKIENERWTTGNSKILVTKYQKNDWITRCKLMIWLNLIVSCKSKIRARSKSEDAPELDTFSNFMILEQQYEMTY